MNVVKLSLLLIIILTSLESIAQTSTKPEKGNWTKGPAERFKGDVWVEYFLNYTISDFVSSRVLFEPAARSNWHKHSGKQIAFAVEGEGYLKEKGNPITLLKKKGCYSYKTRNNSFTWLDQQTIYTGYHDELWR